MMTEIVHGILTVYTIGPLLIGKKFVLRRMGPMLPALGMAGMTALHFLQKNDVGIQSAQPRSQIMDHHALIKMRESFMYIIAGDA